ncbi:GxxExxY protein [Epilithonimonas hungarica]|uniref:GxxExxY protein n=1 Tax=Epilithonimonas hungarica TaxID=454006 RepID=A0A1G7MQJ1_9FLAO|nr:GxxExxY protein [Epilithonimonas hungarica]SDF64053.1 GxxExxY protein [Epilithonimonas hungarica]
MNQKQITELTYKILGACIEVHKNLGSGLLESVYHKALKEEFRIQNINFKSEFVISVQYKGIDLDCGFQCDFLIEDLIIVEIKSVSEFHDLHKAQILNYMNLLKVPKGILVNFNVTNIFKEGQKTFVNKYYEQLN